MSDAEWRKYGSYPESQKGSVNAAKRNAENGGLETKVTRSKEGSYVRYTLWVRER